MCVLTMFFIILSYYLLTLFCCHNYHYCYSKLLLVWISFFIGFYLNFYNCILNFLYKIVLFFVHHSQILLGLNIYLFQIFSINLFSMVLQVKFIIFTKIRTKYYLHINTGRCEILRKHQFKVLIATMVIQKLIWRLKSASCE